jgi:uncharacterized membrane protein YadS
LQHDIQKDSFLPKEAWGMIIIILITLLSKGLGTLFPLIGSLLFAIIIGVVLKTQPNFLHHSNQVYNSP